MLKGQLVALREIRREDVEALHELDDRDAELASLMNMTPWTPRSLASRLAEYDEQQSKPPNPKTVRFAVQRVDDASAACVGSIGLWGIDEHQRTAHVGMGLLPSARGLGYGRDALEVICRYAFELRNLERLQLETLDINQPMQATAKACGFVQEGRLRSSGWLLGRRLDDLVFGLLADEWRATHRPRPTDPPPRG